MDQLRKWFDGSDLVSFAAGAVSALIAGIAFLSQRGISLKSLDFQRRQTETDEGRRRDELRQAASADILVKVKREWRPNSRGKQTFHDYLIITNNGPAIARNVDLESIESRPDGDPPIVAQKDSIFPVRELQVGVPFTTPLMLYGGVGDYFEAVVAWEDGIGRQRVARTVNISR
jgi:hypothetical protein